jgi:phosphoribosyl 1,2-cyclic phosphodiesterase
VSKIRLRFWGVRGSVPCPGPNTVKYGGNTACLELRFGEQGHLVVIDAGTGIRELAAQVMKTDLPKGPLKTQLFLTHTHWDHIMGFPFFIPIFIPTTELDIFGPVTYEDEKLDKIIGGMLKYRYWPVRLDDLAAKIRYHDLKEGSRDLGNGLWVTSKYLNHPILVLGYRFEYQGKVLCTAYDTEPFRNVFDVPKDAPGYEEEAVKEGEAAAREENQKITQFFQGADILVHDAQYTHKEYLDGKVGWGHSWYEHAVNEAHRAGVKRLLLFHHDPDRTDAQLEILEHSGRRAGAGQPDAGVHGPGRAGSRGLSLEQARPTCYHGHRPRGISSAGRAIGSQSIGQGFESPILQCPRLFFPWSWLPCLSFWLEAAAPRRTSWSPASGLQR